MRIPAHVLVVVLALGLLAGGADAKRKPAWTWASLHRPLHVPILATGTPCPVSMTRQVRLDARQGTNGLAGPGPAYPSLSSPGVVEFVYPPVQQQVDFYGSGWGGNKVLWWVARSYKGPVLIRGRQLDGPHLVRFDRGMPPAREIRIPPYPGAYYRTRARDRPSYTRLEAAGCYGYQIDGLGFSRVIVFEGRIVPAPKVIASSSTAPPTVPCDSVVLRPRSLDPGDRILFSRVAFAHARLYQVARVGGERPYWSKVGLYVRAARIAVHLTVPRAWRSRMAITWSSPPVTALRVAGCPSPPKIWNGYAGGFYVHEPACVPLIVRVGDRSTVIRFGIGRRC